MASYPGAVKNFSAVVNGVTKLVASLFNLPYDEITAIETELGTDVAGSVADLKTRLAVALNNDGTLRARVGTYTGNAGSQNIPHGLGVQPSYIVFLPTTTHAYGTYIRRAAVENFISYAGTVKTGVTSDATNIIFTTTGANEPNENGVTYLFYALAATEV